MSTFTASGSSQTISQESTIAAPDPASLRAAALLTLRSKQRRPAAGSQGVVTRSRAVPSPSIELDYGQEGPSSGASFATSSASAAAPPPPPPVLVPPQLLRSEPQPMDIDGAQSREEGEIEEGEISDSEPPPSAIAHVLAPLSATPPRAAERGAVDKAKSVSESNQTNVKLEPVSSPIPRNLLSSTVAVRPPTQNGSSSVLAPVVDATHVRPGLTMTQAQYDTAKDIVLDLLGWGVPPEYLVDCGLSREIVYYVFAELNLRLPSNLDISGIPPYYPPLAPQSSLHTFAQVQPIELPVALPQRHDGTHTERTRRSSLVSPTSVASPSALSATAPAFVPSTTPTAEEASAARTLLDMEQQRREELRARKAVLESRRIKQQISGSSSTSMSVDESGPSTSAAKADSVDVAMVAVEDIPTKTVDDFLRSIGSASQKEKRPAPSPLSFTPTGEPVAMDVDDEAVPGLSISDEAWSATHSLPSASSTTSSMFASGTGTPTSAAAPSSSVTTSFSKTGHTVRFGVTSIVASDNDDDDDDDDEIPGLSVPEEPSSATEMAPPASRNRVAKRPVAADFVDMEPGPSQVQLSNGRTNHYHQPVYKRKTGSFAGLSGMRRCVINLSDSEDEVEDSIYGGESSTYLPLRGPPTYQPPSRSSSRAGIWSSRLNGSPEAIPSGQSTPVALLEKEQEIKRMRELIQQKEQTRLRKLAAASRRSTPPTASTPTIPAHPAAHPLVKQEEDESMATANLRRSHSTDSPYTLSNGNDVAEEQNVLSTVLPIARQSTDTPSISSRGSFSVSTSSVTTPTDAVPMGLEHPITDDRGESRSGSICYLVV
ncbi:hypothetical protein CERSUDRAFT_92617 [Gelatoporia subvermispora B]|uniref:Uncharacterized protein n=1 Tax=Ceriporiopsis subvermispora (strain B) TaxID=914234 RepID=M2R691_CERS8|nr:hypothetical protein CERSUDRAFT_92617 [Gelatoporia subvermispora B]